VVTGVTSTRAAAGDRLAYRVFVDAPAELRLARGLVRGSVEHRDLWLSGWDAKTLSSGPTGPGSEPICASIPTPPPGDTVTAPVEGDRPAALAGSAGCLPDRT